MKRANPIVLSLLGLGALLPILLIWEFGIEAQVLGEVESDSEHWRDVITGMAGGLLALVIPIILLIRDQRRRGAAEAVLQEAIETIPDGFVLYDADHRLVVCNKRFRDFYRYTDLEAAPGVTRSELGALDAVRGATVDGHGGAAYRELRHTFRKGPAGEQELRLADGRNILTRERTTAAGSLVSVQTDVTELKAVQAALAESEQHLREALENISDAFVYFDAEGQLVLCNENYRQLFGYTEDEVAPGATRQQLGDIDETRGFLGSMDEAGAFRDTRRDQLTGEAAEMTFRMADGRWILSRARNMEGGVVSIQTDVTDLKNAQARLQASEQLLRDAIESLEEGFVYFDADDRLVVANSRYKEMFPAQKHIQPGIAFADALKLSVMAGEVPAIRGNEDEWMVRRLAQHRSATPVDEQHLNSGRWVKVSERRTVGGGSVGLRTDVTALKESQMSAEAANRAKTEFLAHMSHELRTPLNSIIGFSEILREQVFGDLKAPYLEYADDIHQSGVHLLTLINDILDISKVEVGELQPLEEDVRMADIAADCLSMMRPRAVDKGLKLDIDLAPGLPLLKADMRHMKQVLINLLSNAIKFTAHGGQIIVIGEHDAGMGLRISVVDNGIGIPADDQARLFEPFSRIENPESLTQDGTGLGLYLVKSMTELNQGWVSLVSAVGEGTTVTLTFPPDRLVASPVDSAVSSLD